MLCAGAVTGLHRPSGALHTHCNGKRGEAATGEPFKAEHKVKSSRGKRTCNNVEGRKTECELQHNQAFPGSVLLLSFQRARGNPHLGIKQDWAGEAVEVETSLQSLI